MIIPLPPNAVTLTDWNMIEVIETVTKHFVGYSLNDGLGRVSSDIVEFDQENNVGKTTSGSTYQLLGGPSNVHPDAEYTLARMTLPTEFRWVYPLE